MLTEQMKKFGDAIASGLLQKDAAILAGYKENHAASQASRLMKNPELITYIEEKRQQRKPKIENRGVVVAIENENDDPLNYLKSVWTNEAEDPALRLNAAKAALPYVHGKVAEKGKKETKEDAAKAATKSGKFGTLNNQLPS